jgi:aconitase A
MTVRVTIRRADGRADSFDARVRIDTPAEFERMLHGGLLPFVYRRTLAAAAGKESGT